MTDKDKPSSGNSSERPEGAADMSRGDAGFDRWLTGHLREMYDDVLRETVPDDLVRMVRQFDRTHDAGESEKQRHGEDTEAGADPSRGRSGR